MLKRMALGLGLALAFCNGALADNPPAPPATNAAPEVADPHLAAAIDLLEAQNARANMNAMVDTMMKAAAASARQSHADVPDDKVKLFTDAFAEEMTNSMDDLLKMEAKVYVEHFSEDELHALAAFYRSDVGKKYIGEIPQIMKETVPLGFSWGQAIAPKAMQHALEKLQKKGVQL
jgi:hypothetical protein